jgi:hypothetical protein
VYQAALNRPVRSEEPEEQVVKEFAASPRSHRWREAVCVASNDPKAGATKAQPDI